MKSTTSSDEETDETKGNDVRNNDSRIKIAKDQKGWSKMENEFALTAAASPGDRRQRRRWVDLHGKNPKLAARPARCMNGVMLDNNEFMNNG